MQLEAQYAQLSRQLNPSQRGRLQKYLVEPAAEVAINVGKEIGKEILKTIAKSQIEKRTNFRFPEAKKK